MGKLEANLDNIILACIYLSSILWLWNIVHGQGSRRWFFDWHLLIGASISFFQLILYWSEWQGVLLFIMNWEGWTEVYKELYYLLCDEEQSILEEGNKIESNEDRSKSLTEKKGSIWEKLWVINSHGMSESIFPVPELSRIFWDPTNLPEFFVLILFPP